MTRDGNKGLRLVLWFVISSVAIALVAYSTRKSPEFTIEDSLKLGAIGSIFVAIAVHVFEWHSGIDYIGKALYLPPLYLLMVLYTLMGYIYDIVRKIFDWKYIIVPRPLGFGKEAEQRRQEYLRAKRERIHCEAETLDSEREYIMAVGRRRNIEVDLERQRLEQEQDLEVARYRRYYGEEPTEEQLKVEMLKEQLTHQKRMNQLELEAMEKSRGSAQKQLPRPKGDDDDDGVVF